MNSVSHHWTEDPVLLEQFVLGRIPAEQLVSLREHLETCNLCREAVEREKEFIGTVRAYGRDRLRLRLKERIERSPSRVVPWPHVLSAAAVILVIVGLGLYNRWWQEPLLVQSEEQIAGGGKTVAPSPEEEATPEEGAATEDTRAAGRGAEEPADVKSQLRRSEPVPKNLAEKQATEPRKKEVRVDEIAQDQAKPAFAARPTQPISADAVDTGRGRQEEFWIDGRLFEIVSANEEKEAAYQEDDSAARGQAMLKDKDALRQQGNYVLRQQPGSALPLEQQRLQKRDSSLPTKVNPRSNGRQ